MKKSGVHIIVLVSFLTACNIFTDKCELLAKVGNHVLTMGGVEKNVLDYIEVADSTLWGGRLYQKMDSVRTVIDENERSLKAEMKDVS